MARPAGGRRTYHHGNLRPALIAAGLRLAAEGGPDAVVLREVARSVGVTANAAYRHFATLTDLRRAIALKALTEMGASMSQHLDRVAAIEPDEPRTAAVAYLREVGRGYVLFALAEPGLFRMAMEGAPAVLLPPAPGNDHGPDWDGRPKPDHFLLLALDRLVSVGALAAVDVPGATMACWATVHGLSMLLPNLAETMPPPQRHAAVEVTLDVLLSGLTQGDAFKPHG